MIEEYEVLDGEFRHEPDPTKGSRFLATVAPAFSAEEAEAFVAGVRAADPDATHHCWAYRVGQPCDKFRFSDDGEPGGSAGRPILQQLEGAGLSNVVCVVTRWYGGTKLGVGGLIRAYAGAAARALQLAPRRLHVVTRRVTVRHSYECTSAVQALLATRKMEPAEAAYGEEVVLAFDVPLRELEDFERELLDRTAGRASMTFDPE